MEALTGAKRTAEVRREYQIGGSVLSRWRQKLAELVADLEKGLQFIRAAQGYGRVTVTIEVRKGGIAMWEVSQAVTRKARATDKEL